MTAWRLQARIRVPQIAGTVGASGDVASISGSALQFPSNNDLAGLGSDQVGPYVALEFANPHLNGLPIWGESDLGVTVVWKVKPLATVGYRAWFWWGQGDGSINFNGYWGMHPYPPGGATDTSGVWEIATAGGDFVDDIGSSPGGGTGRAVSVGTTYTQGMTVTKQGASQKTLRYYHELPNTSSAKYVQRVETTADYGDTLPPSPKIILGDSPWYAGHQHERGAHVLDGIKIFKRALSEADMLSEAADFSQLVTAAGQSHIWWGKNGFASVDDLTCSYGTGRSFAWANANKGTLTDRL